MSGIRRWVYDKLLDRSLTGYPQPTASEIVDLIEDDYEHYREHDKIDIIYFDEDTDEEKTWKVESLKKFIQHWTK